MTSNLVLCAYGQTKQTAEVNNFEADEQRAAKEVRLALHHRITSNPFLILWVVCQGTDDGPVKDVTEVQLDAGVGGTDGEASEPEEKPSDEQAEEKAKEVQVCVRVARVCDVGVCVWVCVT